MPALKPKPFGESERLKKVEELPEWVRPAFSGMDSLNRIQSRRAFRSPHVLSYILYPPVLYPRLFPSHSSIQVTNLDVAGTCSHFCDGKRFRV